MLPGAAQLAVDACAGRLAPSWTAQAQSLLSRWEKVGVCMPRYSEFLIKTKRKDLKRAHVFMNEEAQAKLAEFYLCCALRLRPEAIEEAGQDSARLLQLANEVANEEVEPFFQECRDFVASYDWELHQRLDETTIWREVEDSLFWHHSFQVAAPEAYAAYQQAALPPEASWPRREDERAMEEALVSCSAAVAEGGPARGLAEEVYQLFLEASATPVKATIRTALIDHGILAGEIVYRGNAGPPPGEE